jgi:hypothetical protein
MIKIKICLYLHTLKIFIKLFRCNMLPPDSLPCMMRLPAMLCYVIIVESFMIPVFIFPKQVVNQYRVFVLFMSRCLFVSANAPAVIALSMFSTLPTRNLSGYLFATLYASCLRTLSVQLSTLTLCLLYMPAVLLSFSLSLF